MLLKGMRSSTHHFGEQLRAERERRDMALREIAEATKIRVRYLEALENGEHDRLPGFVFAKGYIRAYADTIGADVDMMVDAYVSEQQQLGRIETKQHACSPAPQDAALDPSTLRLKWFGIASATLLAIAATSALTFWPSSPSKPQSTPATATASVLPVRSSPIREITPRTPFTSVVSVDDVSGAESGIGTDVKQRELIGANDRFALGDSLVFWNRVLDGELNPFMEAWLAEQAAVDE